jgi:hypothetical protein
MDDLLAQSCARGRAVVGRAARVVVGACVACVAFAGGAEVARAQEAQEQAPQAVEAPSNPWGLSDFEWRLTQRAMKARGLTPMTYEEARGKRVEAIHIATEEPLTPEDPWPDWGNAFHVTSQEFVIRREILFQEGEPFDPSLAAESARNLRGPIVLTVALVLPMRGATPDGVQVLVVTKDVWSLRTNTDFLFVGDTLNYFYLSLTENNLLGLHKQTGLTSLLEQDTLTLGAFYADPRLLGSRLTTGQSASVVFNRDSGVAEGFYVGGSLAQPLFSLRTPLAWSLGASASRAISRSFQGDALLGLSDPGTGEVLPLVYRASAWQVSGSVTRSFGVQQKRNATLGYRLSQQEARFGEDDADRASYDPEAVAWLEGRILPRSERVSQLFVRYQFFKADFLALRDVESFALPEDLRLGPFLEIGVGHAEPLLGSDARFESFDASWAWRGEVPFGENPSRASDLVSVGLGYSSRIQDGDLLDNEASASLKNHSPVFLGGRLVWRLLLTHRWNLRGAPSGLGGNAGLRGFDSAAFLARSYLRSNVEWRTLPTELWTFHLGAVAFYDAASLSEAGDWSDRTQAQSVGLGLRLLNPASNRIVTRVDWGFPVESPDCPPPALQATPCVEYGFFPGNFSFGFEQAF